MKMFTSLVFAAVIACQCDCPAEYNLPLVEEECDEIVIVKNPHSEFSRVLFVRYSKEARGPVVYATRLLADDMNFYPQGDKFCMEWQDYWTANRIVRTKNLSTIDGSDEQFNCDGLWWAMNRVMTDLKQP